jgi:hypothetical protein
MRQMIKQFFWIALLACGWQSAWGFALLGPVGNGGDAWQVQEIGYNPLANSGGPNIDYSFRDPLLTGPKNLGEEYRRNVPVMYYACDANFLDYFGSNGVAAVDQAFAILNNAFTNNPTGMTNGLDGYSSGLSEFPLSSQTENYQASALSLYDLKSTTLFLMMEQLGLADAVRYVWALHDRYLPSGDTCPIGMEYSVVQRNFDITASPLNQIQYSQYVNTELYTYLIGENCDAPGVSPPAAGIKAQPADPLNHEQPVASGNGEDYLPFGYFYTGLTRDDVAGLRYLISSNNINTETAAPDSEMMNINSNAPVLLTTSDLNALTSAAFTNNPAALQALFPGLQVAGSSYYFSNVVTSVVTPYLTNYLEGPADAPPTLFVGTTLTTNVEQFFQYTFANVVTNSYYTSTVVTNQTIYTTNLNGNFVLHTNYTKITTNLVTGDYFIIPTNGCPPDILQTEQANVITVTNTLASTNLVATNGTTYFYSQSVILRYTNHVFEVAPCTLVTNSTGLYEGIEKMQFLRADFDSLLGQFFQPITNQYTMVAVINSQPVLQTFQRVATAPDFVFSAADLASGPDAPPVANSFSRNVNFDTANVYPQLAGPGTITNSTTITFDKVGPVYENVNPSFLSGPFAFTNAPIGYYSEYFLWGSFDGTTNDPVVYPNGTSIANLESEVLVQISPTSLPDGTKNVSYPATTFTATGGAFSPPFTWSLADSSILPSGLTLSSGGTILGTPTQSGAFDFVIQLTDSLGRSVQWNYSMVIN